MISVRNILVWVLPLLLLGVMSKASAEQRYYYCAAAPNHSTVVDGCTDGGIDKNNSGTDFTKSCNKHDICYGNINKGRSQCDNDFLKDMLKSCVDSHTQIIKEPHKVYKKIIKCRWYGCFPRWEWVVEYITKTKVLPGLESCESAAVTYHAAVTTFGGYFYQDILDTKMEAKQICADAGQSTHRYGRAPGLDAVKGGGSGGVGDFDDNCGGNTGRLCP